MKVFTESLDWGMWTMEVQSGALWGKAWQPSEQRWTCNAEAQWGSHQQHPQEMQ